MSKKKDCSFIDIRNFGDCFSNADISELFLVLYGCDAY